MTNVTVMKPVTFEGIYEPTEAAGFLRASWMGERVYGATSQTLIRWIRKGLAELELVDVPGQQLLLTFEDLVSLRVIAALRSAGVKWRQIFEADHFLRKLTKHPRPFAVETLWTDRSEVFLMLRRQLASASRHGQLAMDLIEEYLIPVHGLTFEGGVAATWEPREGIRLNPGVQFGSPCLSGTRIPTRAIYNSLLGGDAVRFISQSYGISEEAVEAAIAWEERVAARSDASSHR